MNKTEIIILQKLSKATSNIPKDLNAKQFIQSILKQAIDITGSNLACFYKQSNFNSIDNPLKIKYKIGRYDVPQIFSDKSGLVAFTYECNDVIVLLERKTSPFENILLNSIMNSGICFPVANKNLFLGGNYNG